MSDELFVSTPPSKTFPFFSPAGSINFNILAIFAFVTLSPLFIHL